MSGRDECEHLFSRHRRWPAPKNQRWRCVRCGFVTREYDGVDRMGLRPVHPHMTVAVRGFNTTDGGFDAARSA